MLKFLKQLFQKRDYVNAYSNARSEAAYICHNAEFRPKYTALKRIVTSLTIYALFMSIAYGIIVTRELAETKEHINTILIDLRRINEAEYERFKELVNTSKAKK